MATTLFFNGVVTSIPGSYSKVDATGLEQIGLGAAGIVALIGEAEGGRPASDIVDVADIIRLTKPEAARTTFRSGDLREAAGMTFAPGNDDQILAGAQEIVAMKVNPATQSTATLDNAQGPAIDLESADYGAFTEQVNVSIASGTTQGKLVTIIFEDVTESEDDVGGDDFFNLTYDETNNAAGWDTMTAQVNAGGILQADGTRAQLGLDSAIGTQLPGDDTIEVISTSAADTTQRVTVYGLDAGGDPVSEILELNGTTAQVGTQTFSAVYGAKLDAAAVGTVSVDPSGGGADILTLAPAATEAGMVLGIAMFMGGGALTLVAGGAETGVVIVEGTNAVGATVLEKLAMNGTTPVVGTANWSKITGLVLGDVAAATTVTASGVALLSSATNQDTLQKLADYVNARQEQSDGFALTLNTALTSFDPDNLDVSVAAVDIDNPTDPGFKADLWSVINWINTTSQYVTAARATGATGGSPTNTTAPVFLSGGTEGVTTSADWQAALNLLKQVRVNTVVALTGDEAVHAMVRSHCEYMGGAGKSERDAFVGLQNAAKTDVPTFTEAKTQAIALNTRHVRAIPQAVTRFNIAGDRTRFQPPFAAAIAAGMQAGSPVGTPLTFKRPNVLAFDQDASWNPADDANEAIQNGLMVLENANTGIRWVRNVTTHLSSNNLAFIEGSVNEAVNFAVFEFRTTMEFGVGRQGFAGTVNAAKGLAISKLKLLVDEGVITAQRSLDIELIADVLETSVEIAPAIPINFVPSTIHLVLA